MPVKLVCGNFQYPCTLFEKRSQKKSLEVIYNEQTKNAVDGTEHTLRTADNKILHRKILSTPTESQRSPKKDLSPIKHKLRGPGGNYDSS